MKFRTLVIRTANVSVLLIVLLVGYSIAQLKSAEPGTPVGVWDMVITFRDCTTADVIRTRPGIMTFMSAGIMQEFGTGSAPNDRSDAQGVWRHEMGRNYSSTSKFYRFAADGTFIGSNKLYRSVELSLDGSSISADVYAEIYNAAGTLVGSGCSTETGTRLQ